MIIANLTEETKRTHPSGEYLRRKVGELVRLNRYMSETIDDFRKLLSDSSACETLVLEETLREVFGLMRYSLGGIDVSLDQGEHRLYLCKNEWMQVCIIVISNSLDAFRRRQISDPFVHVDISSSDEGISVRFCDNGGGIDTEVMEKIFEPYFTTHEHAGGSGMGLYIARIIVEEHMRGTIDCRNTPDGTVTTIRLPYET